MFTQQEIADPNFVHQYMINNPSPSGTFTVELSDGPMEMPVRSGLINIILWQSYFKHNTVPSSNDYHELKNINGKTFSSIQTYIFRQFTEDLKLQTVDMAPKSKLRYEQKLVDSLIESFWIAINQIYQFTQDWCTAHVQTISVLSLAKMCKQKEIVKLRSTHLDSSQGTDTCEAKLNHISSELMNLLGSKELEYNPLLEFIETSSLNSNQIPQLLLAYGPRSDIDDSMMKHVINASTLDGIKTPIDYGIESLSAKKAGHSNKVVIKNSQYFYRRLRLVCSSQRYLYPGDCGSMLTIPYKLKDTHKKNFYDKVILVEGQRVVLGPNNIDEYVNTTIYLKSPLGCKHRDGICVACAGRGDMDVGYYSNPNHHIGINASSKVGSSVSQMVLSAKHLIKTLTKIFNLPDEAKKYLYINQDVLFWREDAWSKLEGAKLRIPVKAMGPLEDLSYIQNLPVQESYSAIEQFEILDKNDEVIDSVHISAGSFIPFFTKQALSYFSKNADSIVTDETSITLPLSTFQRNKAFFKYIVVNDDMIAFTESIDKFLKNVIGDYTSIPHVLRDFTSVLYSKTNINIYFVEIVLKAFLITSRDDFRMPEVHDVEDVMFGTMSSILTGRDLSTKLGFEKLVKYFKDVTTYTRPRNEGLFDKYFGF